MALQVEPADAMVADLAEVERAVRSHDEAIYIVDLAGDTGSAVARKASDASSGKTGHGLGGGSQDKRKKESDDEAHRVRVHYIIRSTHIPDNPKRQAIPPLPMLADIRPR